MKSRSGTFASSCLFGALSACLNVASAADNASYLTPAQAIPHGTAPGARAQLLSDIDGRRTYALILARDDEVFTALTDFVQRHDIKAAHFTAIGALRDLQLGWYDLDRKAYKAIPVPGQVEALAVIGDVGVADGKPTVHTHVVVGLPDGQTRGGHLLHAVVSPTLEVFLTEEPATLNKKHDGYSGLTLFEPALTEPPTHGRPTRQSTPRKTR